MLALATYSIWAWVAFIVFVLAFLGLDLFVIHRSSNEPRMKTALGWVALWICIATLFGFGLSIWRGKQEAIEFAAGGFIEFSLSLDNVFVIALLFSHFRIPASEQHRVLFWGILGALVMRGVLIGVGVTLLSRFDWLFTVLGLFLIFSGVRMLFGHTGSHDPDKSAVLRLARRFYPISPSLDGSAFITKLEGRNALTPLAVALILIETSDLIFAVDSVPAIFAVTTKPFIVFTSNVFSILALRSLYIVLAGAIQAFRYLKFGLSLVLVLVGVRMLLRVPPDGPVPWFAVDIPLTVSLAATAIVLLGSIAASMIRAHFERRQKP